MFPPVVLWTLVFIASLFILIKSSDVFTDSAEKIGLYLGLPAFIVGVTIVSIGTSLPELISSIIAVIQGSSEIVVGNVIGSNVTNIFLVLGVAAIVGKQLKIDYELSIVDLPLLAGSSLLLAVTIWDGVFSLGEALLCLFGFFVYIAYTVRTEKRTGSKEMKKEMKKEIKESKKIDWKTSGLFASSAFFIYVGAKYTVESVVELSILLNIGVELIAISAVALGTSLPELMVTYNASKKGKPEMAVGNVLGSCIFNALAVMGFSALFGTIIVSETILQFGVIMMLIATLLFFFMTQDREMTIWEGWMLIIFYVFFIGKLFGLF